MSSPMLYLCRYPYDAWELLMGYDQEKFMGERAAKAVVNQLKLSSDLKST